MIFCIKIHARKKTIVQNIVFMAKFRSLKSVALSIVALTTLQTRG